jgi:GxxExxY protein
MHDETKPMSLLYKEESYTIMGACFEVYRERGCGMSELIYHECLEQEFLIQKIPAVHEPKVELEYKGHKLTQYLRPDFIAYQKVILELKSVSKLNDEHRAQVQNYLRATGLKLGLLINFGHYPKLEWERIVLDTNHPSPNEPPPRLQG